MKNKTVNNSVERLAPCASRAVGLSEDELKWFVAIVQNNTEKSSRDKLMAMGYEVFLPVQKHISVWKDGRKKLRESAVIPGMLFIKTTSKERMNIVTFPFIKNFLVDRAKETSSQKSDKLATIPDSQIERLKYMLNQNDDSFSFESITIHKGDWVRITRGVFCNLIGNICLVNGKEKFGLQIDGLGYACVSIDKVNLEKIQSIDEYK